MSEFEAPPRSPGASPATGTWRDQYPFESQFLDVAGQRYHYLDEGQGPVLLCVHGNPTWSFYWRHLVSAFRDRYRVIVPDHIGCGLSDKPQQYEYRLARHVSNLTALLERLDLKHVTLLAHDWGGAIGLGAAVAHPERFARFVLFNTAAYRDGRIPLRIRLCRTPGLGTVAVRGLNGFARAAIRMATTKPERMTPAVRAGYLFPYDSWANRIATHQFVLDIPLDSRHPSYRTLAGIEAGLQLFRHHPVQLIWGMRDWCFSPHFLERFHREFFPEADVHRLEDAGHYVVEDAHERIVPLVTSFLDRHPLPGAAQPVTQPPALPSPDTVNVAHRLSVTAAARPTATAVAMPGRYDRHGRREYTTATFRELDYDSNRVARGLAALGVTPGMRLALLVKPSIEFILLTFGLLKSGAVPILIDPGMGRKNLLKCLDEAEPAGFVAIPMAQAIRAVLARRYAAARHNVTVGRRWFWGGVTLDELLLLGDRGPALADTKTDSPAAIIFTTGSTGPPKGVLYSHGNFDAQVDQLREFYGIEPGEVNLPGFPLFALFDAAMGVTTVVPDMDPTRPAQVDPTKILEAARDWQVTQAFGSPAIWNRVGQYCQDHGTRLETVRRVLSAGAPVPAHVLAGMLASIHPEGNIHTPYGATESLPVASISGREVLAQTAARTAAGAGTCVGQRFSGIDWRVIRIVDGPIASLDQIESLPAGEIGELIVSGPVVTREYFQRPQLQAGKLANQLGKIVDPATSTVWHRMGDVGYLDDQQRFWFCGRMAHRVETAAGTLFTVRCEAIFNEHPAIYRSALVGVGPAGRQRPVIILEPQPGQMPATDPSRQRLLDEVRALGQANPLTEQIETFLLHPSLPVDIRHNAKIFREQLAVWAAGQLGQ